MNNNNKLNINKKKKYKFWMKNSIYIWLKKRQIFYNKYSKNKILDYYNSTKQKLLIQNFQLVQ
jgi:hypothetical protein